MDDREFWLQVRRAALILIRAIEERFNLDSALAPKK